MPKGNEKQQKVNTRPSPSLMQRLFGGVMSDSLAQSWPELEREWVRREFDMPAETAKTNRVFSMGPLFKWLHPDAYAVTGPFGTIALNRELIEQDKQNVGNILIHELAHVGQGKKGFLRNFYEPSKVEEEAINREALFPRRGDINLPVEKGVKVGPTSQTLNKTLFRRK